MQYDSWNEKRCWLLLVVGCWLSRLLFVATVLVCVTVQYVCAQNEKKAPAFSRTRLFIVYTMTPFQQCVLD
jgi:hypothetical protein